MKAQKYYLQRKAKNPNKSQQYIIGLLRDGRWYDLYFKEDGKWEAWPQPLHFNMSEIKTDKEKGWIIEELTEAEVFVMVL